MMLFSTYAFSTIYGWSVTAPTTSFHRGGLNGQTSTIQKAVQAHRGGGGRTHRRGKGVFDP